MSRAHPVIAPLILFAICFASPLYAQQPDIRPMVEEYRFGSFTDACAVSVDGFENIYVSDRGTNMVYKYSVQGKLLASAGGKGWGNSQFDEPMGLDASLGVSVYVADYNNHRIIRMDKDLHFQGAFSTRENPGPESGFGYPRDVVVSPIGDLYILDEENSRVAYTTGFAAVSSSIGRSDAGEGRLSSPKALCTGKENVLYVLESNRVVAYDQYGNFLRAFGNRRFDGAARIAAFANTIAVTSPSSVYLFQQDGTFLTEWKTSSFLFAEKSGAFKDIAFTKTFVLLLTEQNVIVVHNPFTK